MIDAIIQTAMQTLTQLSKEAKAQGDLLTMYAANRAWRELFEARADKAGRRTSLTNGDR